MTTRRAKAAFWTSTTIALLGIAACAKSGSSPASAPQPKAPYSDYRYEKLGTVHRITPADLPQPYATKSATNGPKLVDRPKDAWPKAPSGFKVELFASGFQEPRRILTAPNGDIFMVESSAGKLTVFRGITGDGKPEKTETFATGLNRPNGIAFYPPGPDPKYVYLRLADQWRPGEHYGNES